MKIVGQEKLVDEITKILKIFKVSKGVLRPHFILAGQSGSGKSYTIRNICAMEEVDFIEVNAAQLTKEGTSGNSLSKALAPLGNLKGKPSVVFVDEFDKLFISGNSNTSHAHETTLGVQNEFLKVLESPSTSVYGDYGKYIDIDISKILFIFAGAFNNEENVTIDKLRTFGVKTEFIGRVGLVYNTEVLTLDDLYIILDKSDLLKDYLKIFTDVKKEDVVSKIKTFLSANYQKNTIGARIVNTLINQYFIKSGNIGFDDVKEITFQEKLSL